jgi:hypothetical protein
MNFIIYELANSEILQAWYQHYQMDKCVSPRTLVCKIWILVSTFQFELVYLDT